MNYLTLSKAAGELASPDSRKANMAFGVLAAAFTDVEIPSALMPLSEDEKDEILRQAAGELQEEFANAADFPPSTQDEMTQFAQRVDGLWRMVVAALPEKAASLAAALDQLADNFVASLTAGGIEPTEMLAVLNDEDDPRHQETVAMMLAQGVQPKLVVRRLNS